MQRSFLRKLVSVFWILLFGGSLLVTVLYEDEPTWMLTIELVLGAIISYALYRFFSQGRRTRSSYRERWNRLFDDDGPASRR